MSGGMFTLNEVAGQWRWLCDQCGAHGRNRPTAQQAQDDFYAARHGHCPRPECGGELHTDPWGTPVQCPHAEPVVQEDTGRRCPRCDCPDGHEQCDHCKVCPHARPEPTPLTREQLEPVVAALHRREGYARAGVGFLLPPFPACPTCGQSPTEMVVRQSERLIEDRVQFGFRPCGHTFNVDGEDLYNAYEAARQQSDPEEAP